MKNIKNSNKKIIIATFLYTNYGGLLQGFALKTFLTKFKKIEVYNLDFYTKWHANDSRVFNLYGGIKSRVGQFIFSSIRLLQLLRRKKKTRLFKNKNFKLTRNYSSVKEFLKNPPKADVFISGSDQVFNIKGLYRDVFYFNFKKNNLKKVAYAASFGGDVFLEEDKRWIKSRVNDFDSVSCREKSGSNFLSQLTGKDIMWVVDPVFLLNSSEWEEFSIAPKSKDKYIFIYALAAEQDLVHLAKKIKKETGYKTICVRPNTKNFIDVDRVFYGCSPLEILGLFQNASYIITDSFHGTAFSIIFDKPFNVFISRPEVSTRIYSLLNMLEASNKIVTDKNKHKFKYNPVFTKIDKKELKNMIKKSKNYLTKEVVY